MIDDMKALLLNVTDKAIDLTLVVVSLDEPKIESRRCGRRNHVACTWPGLSAHDPVDVERRKIDQVCQRLSAPVRFPESERRPKRVVELWRLANRTTLKRTERTYVVVPAADQNATGLVLHRREKMHESHRGVRSPVSVVATMQRPIRSVHSHVNVYVTADSVHDLLATRLMNGTVADDPYVGLEKLGVVLDLSLIHISEPTRRTP